MRMGQFALLLIAATLGHDPDAEAASIDRAKLGPDGQYAYYLSLSAARSPEARERLAKVTRFVVPSLSHRTNLAEQLPVRVTDTLLRIDTRGLGWEKSLPQVISQHYPFRPDLKHYHPYTIRADWFVVTMTDPTESGDSQYRLIYGTPPKTVQEFRKFWGVNDDPTYLFKRHETRSGVVVPGDRHIETRAISNRTYEWETFDSAIPVGDKDPGNYGKAIKFDASEGIVGMYKSYNGEAGALQAYWLANSKLERQEVAPINVAEDHNRLRTREIRNTASCISCHLEGIRPFTVNGFKQYIEQGSRVAADKHTQQQIDAQYQAGIDKEVERNNEMYATAIELCNGYTPAENAKAFTAVVQAYDAPVTREQAARELYMPEEEFRLALGYYSAHYSLSRRLADLAEGGTISRAQWVADFALACEVKSKWGAR